MSEPIPTQAVNSQEEKVAGAFRSAMFWNIANRSLTQMMSVGLFIFLTYRLDPAVFGVFALGVVLVDYFNFQAQSAGVDAVVQDQDFSPRALSSAFWASMTVFALATGALALSGGWFAGIMNVPDLKSILPALACTLLAVPFSIPPSAMLLAQHDFKGIAIRGILSTLLSGVAALAVAFGPAPEWALVAQRAVSVTTASVFLMLRTRWFPMDGFAGNLARRYAAASSRIFAAQAISVSYMRILDVVVGVSFGAAAVGLMRIAARFTDAMYGTFAAPIGSLWVVLLSGSKEQGTDRASLLIRLTQMSALICLPVFAGLMLTAQDLVDLTLDESYAAAGPILFVLAAAGLMIPISYFRNHALTGMRRLNLLLGLSVVDIVIVLISALALRHISTEAIVASILVMFGVRSLITAPLMVGSLGASWKDYASAMLPAYLATGVMALTVWGVASQISGEAAALRLSVKALAGASAYCAYILLVHRRWADRAIGMLMSRGQLRKESSE
ncbi:MAG: oligosaccharide flippase family protein [Hyphomonas sp.]|uniref:oligosaccharide flippase family protein n=1 Tax=Hyphomonas sp. TaxID=87 RepID=UPI0035281E7E